MSRVHYFQRYSQKENVATNNTLLLFSRLYNHSPARFEDFLNALSGDSNLTFEVGMQFAQQHGNCNHTSVPDGLMTQKSIKVVIETKLYGDYGISQLVNHLDSFNAEEVQVLLLLDPRQPTQSLMSKVIEKVKDFNHERHQGITCLATTFTDIIKHFESVLFPYDIELMEILEDYSDFCASMDLLPRDEFMMRAIVTGYTFEQNMQFGVYYDPIERGFASHEYLGLYKNKSIRGVGRVKKIVHAEYDKETKDFAIVKVLKGEGLTQDEIQRVIDIMHTAENIHGWDVYSGHHFFVTDKFEATDFDKQTKYPLLRSKFFDLGHVLELEELPNDKEIAALLSDNSWD
ncbi:hypothetical protein [Shewanella baltica]|uniref:hypothetical protein n=1 Tax=Shewanella baltica TaxID=62322 RepID=UPI003D7A7453